MSQTAEIIIKIKQVGEKAIEDLIKSFTKLQDVISKNQTADKTMIELNKSIEKIGDNVDRVADRVDSTVSRVAKQTRDVADGTTSRIQARAGQAIETLYARSVVGVLAVAGGMELIIRTVGALAVGWSKVGFVLKHEFLDVLAVGGQGVTAIFAHFAFILDGLKLSVNALSTSGGAFLSLMGGISYGIGSLFIFRVFLSESSLLLRRLIGHGEASLTMMERGSRSLATLDLGIHTIGLTAGQALKTVGLGILTVVGPFSGLLAGIPFLNSVITSLLRAGTEFRLRFFAFFGSARAQVELIFLQAKQLASGLLPMMNKFLIPLFNLKNSGIINNIAASLGSKKAQALKGILQLRDAFLQALPAIIHALNKFAETGKKAGAQIEEIAKKGGIGALLSRGLGQIVNLAAMIEYKFFGMFFRGMGKLGGIVPGIGALLSRGLGQIVNLAAMIEYKFFGMFFRGMGKLGGIVPGIGALLSRSFAALFGKKTAAPATDNLTKAMSKVPDTAEKIFVAMTKVAVAAGSKSFNTLAKETSSVSLGLSQMAKEANALPANLKKLSKETSSVAPAFEQTKKSGESVGRTLKMVFAILDFAPVVFANSLKALIPFLQALSRFRKVADFAVVRTHFHALMDTILNDLRASGKGSDEMVQRIEKLKSSFSRPNNIQKFREQLRAFQKDLLQLEGGGKGTSLKRFGKIGEEIIKSLNGLHTRMPATMEKLLGLLMSFFPQSPAKRGPLTKLRRAGQLIGYYLAQGMLASIGLVGKNAARLGETIAKYFPRSLPVIGPLVHLATMGLKIPYYLGVGIQRGFGYISSILSKFTSMIAEPLEKAAKIEEFSKVIGVSVDSLSSLDYAITTVGGSIDDLQFMFQRINDMLSKELTAEESQKFSRLGIDIGAAVAAQEPAVALYQQFADVLKNLTPNTREWKEALESLGLFAGSKGIHLLRLGKDGIVELQKEGVRLGATISPVFAENALRITKLNAQLRRVKETIINDVLAPILPKIEWSLLKIKGFLEENRVKLNALITFVVKGLAIVIKGFGLLLALFFTDMPKFFDVIKATVPAITTFVIDSIIALTNGVKQYILSFAVDLGVLLWNVFFGIFRPLLTVMQEFMAVSIKKAFLFVLDEIGMLATKYPIPGLAQLGEKIADIRFNLVKDLINIEGNVEDKSKRIASIMKDSLEEVRKSLGKIIDTAQAIGREIEKNVAGGEIQENFKVAMEKIRRSVSGTTLAPLVDELEELLKRGAFDELAKKAKAAQAAVSKSIEDAGETAEKVSAKIINNVKRVGDKATTEARKSYLAIQIALGTLKNKTAKDDLARVKTQIALETLELELQQAENLEAFLKMKVTEKQIADFMALQAKERADLQTSFHIKNEQERLDATLAAMSLIQSSAQNVSSMFADLYELSGESIKEFFYISKAAAIAETIINTAAGIMKAMVDPGGFAGIALGSIIGAMGAINIAKIMAQTLGYAAGGLVSGGKGGVDDIPARLTAGEYVQPAHTVNYYGSQIMEGIRQRLIPREIFGSIMGGLPRLAYSPALPHFQAGGLVGAQKTNEQGQTINVVNFVDKELVAQYLASNPGQRLLLNVLGNNRSELKRMVLE